MEKLELNKKENLGLVFDFMQRTMVHYALWYQEVKDNFGAERAAEIMEEAWQKSFSIQMKRLSKVLGFELEDGIPKALLELDDEKIDELREAVAVNWLANDGVWFQAVEFSEGMKPAKKCNDAAWGKFSPYEALRIKKILSLSEHPGIAGLKKAMAYRLYGTVNTQSFANETENSIDFFMNECRVQSARKRKGLDDYPCKSGGIIEYTTFAKTIDSHIKTRIIGCPPDVHPDNWYCGWQFYISSNNEE
ncbi:MAG: cytosolic protein [Bacteroidales bacterium]|nr:cytosolic protein [Bacteroidales bacterium]